MDTVSSDKGYTIKLNNFEGPMDLLLHLIKKAKIAIHDIPIALITEQYLAYIQIMQELNLDVAGDFLVMASYLIYLKSRSLLFSGTEEEEDPEEVQKRLAQRLLDYQTIREGAKILAAHEAERSKVIPAAGIAFPGEEEMIEADLFDLLDSYYFLTKDADQAPKFHDVALEKIAIEDKMADILCILRVKKKCFFRLLLRNTEKGHIIISFLAILELGKTNKIKIFQGERFGDIMIRMV